MYIYRCIYIYIYIYLSLSLYIYIYICVFLLLNLTSGGGEAFCVRPNYPPPRTILRLLLIIIRIMILRSVFKHSNLFLRPRPWQFEI